MEILIKMYFSTSPNIDKKLIDETFYEYNTELTKLGTEQDLF